MKEIVNRFGLRGMTCALAAAAALVAVTPPASAETLRVGKVVAQNFGFIPLDVGVAQGFFAKRNLQIDEFDFGGGAKQQQAIIAGNIDIAIGGGTDLAFEVKGSPATGIASISASPSFMGYIVGADSTAKTADDLKGKTIGVSTQGSLTKWLVDELNRVKGWGDDGAKPIAIGGQLSTEVAALKTHQVDAFVDAPAIGYQLQSENAGRLLITAWSICPSCRCSSSTPRIIWNSRTRTRSGASSPAGSRRSPSCAHTNPRRWRSRARSPAFPRPSRSVNTIS